MATGWDYYDTSRNMDIRWSRVAHNGTGTPEGYASYDFGTHILSEEGLAEMKEKERWNKKEND